MKKKKQGFTLIEMILVLAISGIVLGILGSIFITGHKVFSDSDVKSSLQIEAQSIQEKLSNIGMAAVGIISIKDLNGNDFIETFNKSKKIVNSTYEELRNQGLFTNSKGESDRDLLESVWIPISLMNINSYINNSGEFKSVDLIKYEKNNGNKTGKLSIENSNISTNVKSILIKPNNIDNTNSTFKEANGIIIKIILEKNKGYSNLEYPVTFKINFRNYNGDS